MKDSIEGCLIIIDDDPKVIDRMLSLFSDMYQCHTAMTGKDGLALYQQLSDHRVLVVCDVNLPDISGLEVCRSVKGVNPQTFVILLTSYNDNESRMSGLLAHADNYIDKIVADDELKLLVSNVYSTLNQDSSVDSNDDIDSIPDEIFCALEVEVRSLIGAHYLATGGQRKGGKCTSKYVAERLGRSHRTFQREIKVETGYSFKQLQLVVRLEEAQGLFAKGYNVNQVADLLSFSSPAHLSRAFKEEFGITPSKYRSLT